MLKDKSQHYNFCHEALPTIFHSQTKGFMQYIERDGLKFLRFWWDHVGERLDDSKMSPFAGMNYEIHDVPERKSKIVLVRLPNPTQNGEFHMMALVKKPEKRYPMFKLPYTQVLALEHVPTELSPTGTMLVEITPRGRKIRLKEGPAPSLKPFFQLVVKTVWKK
jgi:hypothetical protein